MTEPPNLAFENIGKGFEGTVTRTGDTSTVPSIVEEGIDRFLQHPFFISENHLWRTKLYQFTQSVVPIDDTAIQIVEITGSKTSAFEGDKGA